MMILLFIYAEKLFLLYNWVSLCRHVPCHILLTSCHVDLLSNFYSGAFLMAVFTRGMTPEEVANLTSAMVSHSDKLRWNDQQWAKFVVDKHSTGGVGDKTSHLLAPMVAACGGKVSLLRSNNMSFFLKVPMISGRGLGITGGTIDKLESIEGYSASIGEEKLKSMLNDTGFFIVGQTERLVPADRQLYKYRDVTGTVASVPLISCKLIAIF